MLKYFTDRKKLEKYYNKFSNFIDKNSKEVPPKYDFWKQQVSFVCPACLRKYDEGFGNGFTWSWTKSKALWHIQKCFALHLFATIRLSGDIDHIKLLIKIVGKDLAKVILTEMAKKNMLVALKLKLVVDELNKEKPNEK